jgi:hypothetical protein
LVVQELSLSENDILSCKGITVDTQLQRAIIALRPNRTTNCPTTPSPTATPTPSGALTPTPSLTPGATITPSVVATPTPKP